MTLEGLKWYHMRRKEYEDHRSMMAEFPSDPEEAFSATNSAVFSSKAVERLRKGCCEPLRRGEPYGAPGHMPSDLSAPGFSDSPDGRTLIWTPPVPGMEYLAAVDVGGRSAGADWSVISVIGRGDVPEIVAQWRGHIDHDLLAWKAAALASYYNKALLVVESNSLESDTRGEGQYILDRLAGAYPNLYHRPPAERGGVRRPGFHTNRATKASMIAHLIAMVRDGLYVERSGEACDELLQYEALPGGAYAARRGCHDDILMTRAMALWVHAADPAAQGHLTAEDVETLMETLWG